MDGETILDNIVSSYDQRYDRQTIIQTTALIRALADDIDCRKVQSNGVLRRSYLPKDNSKDF